MGCPTCSHSGTNLRTRGQTQTSAQTRALSIEHCTRVKKPAAAASPTERRVHETMRCSCRHVTHLLRDPRSSAGRRVQPGGGEEQQEAAEHRAHIHAEGSTEAEAAGAADRRARRRSSEPRHSAEPRPLWAEPGSEPRPPRKRRTKSAGR